MYFDWFRYCTNRYRKYKRSAALEIDIEFKRLSAILREELEKFDFSKYERYQKMTVNEMINFDNNFDTHMELNNQEIYDLVTEKIIEEKEEEGRHILRG